MEARVYIIIHEHRCCRRLKAATLMFLGTRLTTGSNVSKVPVKLPWGPLDPEWAHWMPKFMGFNVMVTFLQNTFICGKCGEVTITVCMNVFVCMCGVNECGSVRYIPLDKSRSTNLLRRPEELNT